MIGCSIIIFIYLIVKQIILPNQRETQLMRNSGHLNNALIINIMTVGIIASLISCRPDQTTEDSRKSPMEFPISEIEWTSSEKQAARDSLIISNINSFLQENRSAIVRNYLFLCDRANIEPLRNFDPGHKDQNIDIHIGKQQVSIRPIPGSYKIAEGPFARYKITDDSLGRLHSYVIDISLADDYTVLDYSATLRFAKEIDGVNTVVFTREIQKDEIYLIEERKETHNWQ